MALKKGSRIECEIQSMKYPGFGFGIYEGETIRVKQALPGQTVACAVTKRRGGRTEARLLEVVKRAPNEQASFCPHFGACGGCMFQTLSYADHCALKREMVATLFEEAGYPIRVHEVVPSPSVFGYRNKMEFSFGDALKGGPMTLGMHRKGHHHSVVNVPSCYIADGDFGRIQSGVLAHAEAMGWRKYHKYSHEGFARHLMVRKAAGTGEIMVALSATTQDVLDREAFVSAVRGIELETPSDGRPRGQVVSILYIENDGLGDVVAGPIQCLYGKSFIEERLMGLSFKITADAFFQTNTAGAERLYGLAMDALPELSGKLCFDLFSGTGTLAQLMAQRAREVVGVELVPSAVDMARDNAARNGLDNCTFICGDVFKVLSELTVCPDVIMVDPPRAGLGSKVVEQLAAYNVPEIVYVSCNPATLLMDFQQFLNFGYAAEALTPVDMFPWTGGVETVALLSKL